MHSVIFSFPLKTLSAAENASFPLILTIPIPALVMPVEIAAIVSLSIEPPFLSASDKQVFQSCDAFVKSIIHTAVIKKDVSVFTKESVKR